MTPQPVGHHPEDPGDMRPAAADEVLVERDGVPALLLEDHGPEEAEERRGGLRALEELTAIAVDGEVERRARRQAQDAMVPDRVHVPGADRQPAQVDVESALDLLQHPGDRVRLHQVVAANSQQRAAREVDRPRHVAIDPAALVAPVVAQRRAARLKLVTTAVVSSVDPPSRITTSTPSTTCGRMLSSVSAMNSPKLYVGMQIDSQIGAWVLLASTVICGVTLCGAPGACVPSGGAAGRAPRTQLPSAA